MDGYWICAHVSELYGQWSGHGQKAMCKGWIKLSCQICAHEAPYVAPSGSVHGTRLGECLAQKLNRIIRMYVDEDNA